MKERERAHTLIILFIIIKKKKKKKRYLEEHRVQGLISVVRMEKPEMRVHLTLTLSPEGVSFMIAGGEIRYKIKNKIKKVGCEEQYEGDTCWIGSRQGERSWVVDY